jgi:hypothetical protein
MGNGEQIAVESLLVDALATTLTRRLSERIVSDVRRNRVGAELPSDVDELLRVVRGDLAQATFLRVGARASRVLAVVEERVLGLAALPPEAWDGPRVRLVYVGQNREVPAYLARELGAQPVLRVDELFELLIALDTDERTLVVIDSDDTTLDPAVIARFVPDFASHVLTFVASTSHVTREVFLSSGAAFRATLRTEPMDHPDVPQMLRDLISGVANGTRRPRGGISTTTEPARAA